MRVSIFVLLAMLVLNSICFAGIIDDTRQLIDDMKQSLKGLVQAIYEAICIFCVGWLFSFVVDKKTAKMIKVLMIVCSATWFVDWLFR